MACSNAGVLVTMVAIVSIEDEIILLIYHQSGTTDLPMEVCKVQVL